MSRCSSWITGAFLAALVILPACTISAPPRSGSTSPAIDSLNDLSIAGLRQRSYATQFAASTKRPCPSLGTSMETQILTYESDGLQVFTRLDTPASRPPAGGYPVLVFAHGWVGAKAAPDYDFACSAQSSYGALVAAYLDAGFVVLVPGFRGHGTTNGRRADGQEWMIAFDNGSYLSPAFYTIDLLNLIAGVDTLPATVMQGAPLPVNTDRIYLAGHSQGGDVVLMALAATGENALSGLQVAGASIWAGTFVDRFTQLATYPGMESTPQSFLAGDGTWTGTAVGRDGSVNPDFIFGYPPDWIGSPHRDDWDWQKEYWGAETVEEVMRVKLTEMYDTLNTRVGDVSSASFVINRGAAGQLEVIHDPRVSKGMARIGGFTYPQFLSEPLNLHTSDRDFYSFPEWNEQLCTAVNAGGGQCRAHIYTGNTHALMLSEHGWFSPLGSLPGFDMMVERDLALFGTAGAPRAQDP